MCRLCLSRRALLAAPAVLPLAPARAATASDAPVEPRLRLPDPPADRLMVALTLDAAGTGARAPDVKELAVRVGEIPVTATSPDAVTNPDIRAWYAREGAPPNWWAALGHDAAILARGAVAALPLDATSDPAEVGKRRLAAKQALAAAQAPLWTSEARGFSAAHVIVREAKVVELGPGATKAPGK